MRETRWWESPFLTAGWWTKGAEKERGLGIEEEELVEAKEFEVEEEDEEVWEVREKEGSSMAFAKRVSNLEAEHPIELN